MRGHQSLIDLRRRGYRPAAALVHVGPRTDFSATWQEWGGPAHIEIDDADDIGLLDLRCLVGVSVIAWAFDIDKAKALHKALVASGARFVMTAAYRQGPYGCEPVWEADNRGEA